MRNRKLTAVFLGTVFALGRLQEDMELLGKR